MQGLNDKFKTGAREIKKTPPNGLSGFRKNRGHG
jgi:hypothetical protein